MKPKPRKERAGHVEGIDLDARPDHPAGGLDEPAFAQRHVVAEVAGQREAARVEVLPRYAVGGVDDVVLIKIPARLAIGEEAALAEGRVDAGEGNLRVAPEGRRRRPGRHVLGSRFHVAGGDAEVPVGAAAAAVEDRDVVAGLEARVVEPRRTIADLRASDGHRGRSKYVGRIEHRWDGGDAGVVVVDRAGHAADPHPAALLIGTRAARSADEGAGAGQERGVDGVDDGDEGVDRAALSERQQGRQPRQRHAGNGEGVPAFGPGGG